VTDIFAMILNVPIRVAIPAPMIQQRVSSDFICALNLTRGPASLPFFGTRRSPSPIVRFTSVASL